MKKTIKILIAVLFLGVFIWTIYFLYQKSEKPAEVFKTEGLEYKDIVRKTVATGTVAPRNETEIKPQVSGIVEKLFVKEGQLIKNGDKIAQIRIIPNVQNLNMAEAQVKNAKINLDEKKTIYERQKMLHQSEVISLADYEKHKFAYDLALQDFNTAQNNLNIVKKGVSLDANVSTNTIVESTIDGMVLDIPIEVGYSVIETNTFNPGTVIATVADMGDMEFKGTVDETEVGKIKTGMNLLLNIGAIDNIVFDAKLTYIAPKGKMENGAIVFDIKADVILIDSVFVRAGYSANADIVLQKRDSVLAINEKNLHFENGDVYVEVQKDSLVFEKQKITIGLSDGIYAEVLTGLNPKDKVKVK